MLKCGVGMAVLILETETCVSLCDKGSVESEETEMVRIAKKKSVAENADFKTSRKCLIKLIQLSEFHSLIAPLIL